MKVDVNKEISFKFAIDDEENETIKKVVKFIMEVADLLEQRDCEVLYDEDGDVLCEASELNLIAEKLDTMRYLFYQNYELKAE